MKFPSGTRVEPLNFHLPNFLALCIDEEEITTAVFKERKHRSRNLNVRNSSSRRCSDPFRAYWVASEGPLLSVVAMSVCTLYIS